MAAVAPRLPRQDEVQPDYDSIFYSDYAALVLASFADAYAGALQTDTVLYRAVDVYAAYNVPLSPGGPAPLAALVDALAQGGFSCYAWEDVRLLCWVNIHRVLDALYVCAAHAMRSCVAARGSVPDPFRPETDPDRPWGAPETPDAAKAPDTLQDAPQRLPPAMLAEIRMLPLVDRGRCARPPDEWWVDVITARARVRAALLALPAAPHTLQRFAELLQPRSAHAHRTPEAYLSGLRRVLNTSLCVRQVHPADAPVPRPPGNAWVADFMQAEEALKRSPAHRERQTEYLSTMLPRVPGMTVVYPLHATDMPSYSSGLRRPAPAPRPLPQLPV